MGSTSFGNKSKLNGFRAKSSSIGSEKEMNGKLKRNKLRRPTRMNDYGLKRIPDYTDLAYKEAVSKLRYFFSGNSAPSVRSYGGSASIKNLDDSDADIDKKYPYNLSEYKPRPRLTAKYTTLYADSLNNYTPPIPANNVPPATNTTDLTGGTNPDVVNFIQKQEEYIEQLERESQYCREELNNLLGKVKEVISENEHLHEAQKNKMITRMFHNYAGSETDDLDDVGDSTGLDSDNKGTPSKNRRPRSRITKLEGPNIVFESRIAELEAQLTQAKIDLKKVQDENNENKRKLANGLVDSTCLDGFKRQIDNLQRDKNALENQVSKLKLSLEQRDSDVDGRYKRGSEAIENQLREERNNLEAEIRRLKDELSNERSKVRAMSSETSRRALHERSAAEQRYTQHFDELRHELAAQCDNVAKLQLDLERQRREESELKREISMKNAAIEELKMELKNKTASLQADLAQAHAEKASLEEELASARLTIERNQRQAKHESNRLNSEIHSLRQRLDRSDADLVHSRRENLRLSEQISNLEKEINMKTLTPISPEKNKKEKEISSALESIENKHAKTVAGLESMIHSQNSLMEKLTNECRLLTDKLDDANRRHKIEKSQLLCRNTELMRKLRNLWSSHKKYCTTTIAPFRSYTPQELGTLQRQVESLGRTMQTAYSHPPSTQAPTTHSPTAVRIPDTTATTRPNYTRDEPTRDTTFGEPTRTKNSRVDDKPRNINDLHNTADTNIHKSSPESNINTITHETPRSRQISKQNSRESVEHERKLSQNSSKESFHEENINQVNDNATVNHSNTDIVPEQNTIQDQPEQKEQHQPLEEKQEEHYDDQNYGQEYHNYDQGYDQNQPTSEYQPQEYEQQQYSEQQYENYEQYPQQYADPNAQYEGQYENYATDGNYTEQNYDNTQYNQESTPQYEENVSEIQQNVEISQKSAPNEKLASQS
ncbi:serologically defined colon cancer antigen 8 homolog [Zerene cesonia]|uniref:serologically defined colon cancer antigen 8 homolog n=1 Tax=Zerene cesonia TaxID=33412 RepID=UPI0018E547EA|nr:serologically defined colon cancer antigen 8 homolog [Zerene cesonia]